MPAFANPFNANVGRKMTKEELIQAIRLDIAGSLKRFISMTLTFRPPIMSWQKKSSRTYATRKKHTSEN
jgi:hypothetical protein